MKNIMLKLCPIVLLVAIFVAGCGSTVTYQSILDEYTNKLQQATPTLIEEFEEAAENSDIMALAELSNEKIVKLAEISTEGISKMAELQLKNGDENSVYTEWAGKLTAVYEAEAKKITDIYMEKAMG